MSPNPRTQPSPPSPPTASLDPRHLGRPVHLLPAFAAQFRDDLAQILRTSLNRRYRASFQLGDATLSRTGTPAESQGRWLSYAAPAGRIGFSLDRGLLLAVLDYRYGAGPSTAANAANAAAAASSATSSATALPTSGLTEPAQVVAQATSRPPAAATARETATEERLATAFGAQLVKTLATHIDAATGDFQIEAKAPDASGWTLAIQMQEPSLGIEGRLAFMLDDAWMGKLLQKLTPPRPKPREPLAAVQPLAQRLQLTLVGRLIDKELPLGVLLALEIGDVIPVTVGATDVLIDESRLFRATVAERKGKLCLTSFDDVD